MKQITIGDKPLMKISPEDLLELAVIQGCCACQEYWNYPVIIDFCDTMFSHTVFIQYYSTKKKDERVSDNIIFYFHANDLTYHYHRENDIYRNISDRLGIEAIKFLIEKGYDVPIC